MPRLRLALVQADPTVGDLAANSARAFAAVQEAAKRGAELIVFPEMFLTGYPIEDLALRPSFQEASRDAAQHFARDLADAGLGDLVVVLGYLDRLDAAEGLGRPHRGPLNAAAVIQHGEIRARYAKHHLPNYGVFDEFRYFVPGDEPCFLRIRGIEMAIAICEDLWRDAGGPITQTHGASLLLVLNGSPYERDKDDVRLELCQRRAREYNATLAYVNMIGGQDELVFDGDSLVVDATGTLLARATPFADEVLVLDLDLPAIGHRGVDLPVGPPPSDSAVPTIAPRPSELQEIYEALTLGLRDYVDKNGFRSVILGLSGGIDSALVAAIACDALGADRVHGVSLPSVYSSEHSRSDAQDLAERTGLHFRTVPIASMVDAFQGQLDLSGLAEENLQARVRGTTLMALSNAEGHLVLATGNKSEISVGYSTIYGDAVGGFAPIKDVPKTLVWALSRWRNDAAEAQGDTPPIPPNSISKPPSAELRPGQVDEDSLPPYELLDDILDDYVEHDRGAADLVAQGFNSATVERILQLTDAAEYKRRQYPPGTKISLKAFGRDRRLPVTNRWRETAPPPVSS